MKSVLLATAFFWVACTAGVAQETTSSVEKKKMLSGFEWLKQFEGTWNVVSKAPGADGEEHKGTMTSRAVGGFWMVSEQRAKMGTMDFEAVQTLGFDSKTEQFTGTWVDSSSSYTWHLKGSLDDSGKKLTMASEGADWTDKSKTRQYRDVYEFKSADEIVSWSQMLNDAGEWETFMNGKMTRVSSAMPASAPVTTVTPFLMFQGKAEEAIELYKAVFSDFKVENIKKYKSGEAGKEGTVQVATIEIAGQKVKVFDSPIPHEFDFTPSFSFFVECESMDQLKERFGKLSEGGKVMMPLNDYGFSQQFGWTSDKYGVSWQLNLNSK